MYRAGAGDPDLSGMGTTVVALAVVAHDGDELLALSQRGRLRGYRYSGGELDQLTTDHSLVADLVREGSLSPDEASIHPQRNILTRVLGVYEDVPVDAFAVEPRHGDRYLLCSDGLFNEVPEDAIAAVLRRPGDPADAADELVRLAREGGGRDNITVVIVDVVDDGGRAEAASASWPASRPGPPLSWAAPGPARPTPTTGPRPAVRGAGGGAPWPPPDDDYGYDDGDGDGAAATSAAAGAAGSRGGWPYSLVLLAVVGGSIATIQWYGRSAYFVGLDGDRVAIFKGRPGGLLWIEPTLVETSDLDIDRVPEAGSHDIEAGKEQPSLEDARHYVDNVTERADELTRRRPPRRPPPPSSTTTTLAPPAAPRMNFAARRRPSSACWCWARCSWSAPTCSPRCPTTARSPPPSAPCWASRWACRSSCTWRCDAWRRRPTACCCRWRPCSTGSATCSSSASTRPRPAGSLAGLSRCG